MVMSAVVLCQHAGGVGHGDGAGVGAGNIDIINAIAEIGDQLEALSCLRNHMCVDPVGDGGHQDIRHFDRFDHLGLGHWLVMLIEPGVKELAHARFHSIGKLAGYNNDRLGFCHRFALFHASYRRAAPDGRELENRYISFR